eukprot:scaffold25978_cov66-Skeletonema_marinoi.AAC.1
MKGKPASLVGMLLVVTAIEGSSAFQQCRPSSQHIIIRSGASHRRRKNTCSTISFVPASYSALKSSSFDGDFDDFDDDFDSFGEWGDDRQQQQYNNINQWD